MGPAAPSRVAAVRRAHLYFTLACAVLMAFSRLREPLLQSEQRGHTAPVDDLDTYRRAGCDNFTNDRWQPLRPAFHITVPWGWMNEAHGMFQLNGTTHIFVQYNPKGFTWDAPFWGHVASPDLAHLVWLPPAILPDAPYDYNGAWSGAATVTEEGVPILTYTGGSRYVPEQDTFYQTQSAALPQDMSDPLLKWWRKPDTNPFLVQAPPGATNYQFRDPTEGRGAVHKALTLPENPNPLPKSHYALAIGVQAYCLGGAGIYTAPTMEGPWTFVGSLYNQMNMGDVGESVCASSDANRSNWRPSADGASCDQFGADQRMWEVVDFVELEPGVFMLKWSDQTWYRGLFDMEWYILGSNIPFDYDALVQQPSSMIEPLPSANSTSTLVARSLAVSAVNDAGTNIANTASFVESTTGSTCSTTIWWGTTRTGGYEGLSPVQGSTGPKRTIMAAAAAFELQDVPAEALSGLSNHATLSLAASRSRYKGAGRVQQGDEQPHQDDQLPDTGSFFTGMLDGEKYPPTRLDYGSVFASMVFETEDHRNVMFCWAYETAAGCRESCSLQVLPVHNESGYKGVQTMPRELKYSKETKSLIAYPVAEMALLRAKQVYNKTAIPLTSTVTGVILVPVTTINNTAAANSAAASGTDSNSPVNKVADASRNVSAATDGSVANSARQFEVHLNFTLKPNSAMTQQPQADIGCSNSCSNSSTLQLVAFSTGVRILTGNKTYTDVYMNGTAVSERQQGLATGHRGSAQGNDMSYIVNSLAVWVDRSNAGGATNVSFMEGGPIPLPINGIWQLPKQQLSLSVWVDHSILEVFAMGGLATVTSRIYPASDSVAWGLAAWAKQCGSAAWPSGNSRSTGSRQFMDDLVVPCAATECADGALQNSAGVGRDTTSTSAADGGWTVLMDGLVWEVGNAWLPVSC